MGSSTNYLVIEPNCAVRKVCLMNNQDELHEVIYQALQIERLNSKEKLLNAYAEYYHMNEEIADYYCNSIYEFNITVYQLAEILMGTCK